jgi:hexosaminidase
LLIDGHPVVKNDGQHSAFEKEGQTALKEGYHKIELRYFQAGGRKALQVFIKVPGKEKVEITKDMLVN